ncbi:MAG: hypothetical protein CMJ87_09900 [Planctomycetes bacterium]|nr:hypothetical protein [Planctomycetota bacterium]MDP6520704.1 glycosyltransferase family 4 protein [Planctomycetota bacterium]
MRILHVMEATIGGTRRHLVDVATGQRARGLEVEVAVATRRDPDFPRDLVALEQTGVGVHRIEMGRSMSPGRDGAHLWQLCRLLEKVQPDIVHTHSSKAGVLGRTASLATGIGRRFHTPHTFAFLFEALFGPAKRQLFRTLEQQLAASTERLLAVSPTEAQTFRDSGVVPAERIAVVANGIDATPWLQAQPADLGAFGLDPTRPTAAVIGLMYPAKGQDLALEALAQVAGEDLQLLIAGPDEWRGELEQLARKLGVAQRVAFSGPRRDVPAILAAVDLLLLPSRWEGMPYIVLEAMASALPVVATPVDGARDLVRHGATGFLADEIGAAALGAALGRCLALSEEERRELGEAGRASLLAEHSLDSMLDDLLALYENRAGKAGAA